MLVSARLMLAPRGLPVLPAVTAMTVERVG